MPVREDSKYLMLSIYIVPKTQAATQEDHGWKSFKTSSFRKPRYIYPNKRTKNFKFSFLFSYILQFRNCVQPSQVMGGPLILFNFATFRSETKTKTYL